jgi:cyanate lyase
MSRIDVTEKILTAKITRGLKWADVAAEVGLSKEWVTAENSSTKNSATES